MGQRVRGISLGFLILAINILLVGALIVATSAGAVSEVFNRNPDSGTMSASTGDDTVAGADADTATDAGTDLRSRFAAGEPLDVVVLGDRTGVGEDGWVGTWARGLATARPVELLSLTEDDPGGYAAPVAVAADGAQGDGLITLRNASVLDGTPGDTVDRVGTLVPADTDVVLLNFGRSNNWVDIGRELDDLLDRLVADVPDTQVRVIIQPPRQDGQASIERDVRQWGRAHGVEAIDVAEIFTTEDLLADTVSDDDPLDVNARGAEVWARVVQNELFGDLPTWEKAPSAEGST